MNEGDPGHAGPVSGCLARRRRCRVAAQRAAEQLRKDLVAFREVLVGGGGRDTGRLGEVLDLYADVALFEDRAERRVEQQVPRAAALAGMDAPETWRPDG